MDKLDKTNYDKMIELTGHNTTIEQIKSWAYRNRIMVMELHYDEPFECMENSVDYFIEKYDYHGKVDEHEAWDNFLNMPYVE